MQAIPKIVLYYYCLLLLWCIQWPLPGLNFITSDTGLFHIILHLVFSFTGS